MSAQLHRHPLQPLSTPRGKVVILSCKTISSHRVDRRPRSSFVSVCPDRQVIREYAMAWPMSGRSARCAHRKAPNVTGPCKGPTKMPSKRPVVLFRVGRGWANKAPRDERRAPSRPLVTTVRVPLLRSRFPFLPELGRESLSVLSRRLFLPPRDILAFVADAPCDRILAVEDISIPHTISLSGYTQIVVSLFGPGLSAERRCSSSYEERGCIESVAQTQRPRTDACAHETAIGSQVGPPLWMTDLLRWGRSTTMPSLAELLLMDWPDDSAVTTMSELFDITSLD
nr:hypothetical protein Iba_chr14eCG7060 [Ipomoea batatas]